MQKLHIRCQVDHFTDLQVLQAEDLSLVFYQAGSVHLSAADEARLLALLMERAGGIHNLALDARCKLRMMGPTCQACGDTGCGDCL